MYKGRYSDKATVLNKWINLNRRLNKNREINYYRAALLESQSLVEGVIENVLKDENGYIKRKDENGKFYGVVDKLRMTREKGKVIPEELVNDLIRIKRYRNQAAHGTGTVIAEQIDYDRVEESLGVYGEILYCLGMIDKDDIFVGVDKLKAQEDEVIDDAVVLEKFIGEGASGRVFKAFHKRLGIYVAVKEIKHNSVDADVIENEKKILLSLKHNGIPNIYDVIAENRTYYIVMEYIDGANLESFIHNVGMVALNVVVDIGRQLCDIVDYLHEKNVIYNDLKPGNILIDNHNNISLIDFGISYNSTMKGKSNDRYSGTYAYSSPEQIKGEITSISNDIYSLGATLYYISEGEDPIQSSEQRFKKSTDKRMIQVIEKAMDYNINNRYKSVIDIKNDLMKIKNGGSGHLMRVQNNIVSNAYSTHSKEDKIRDRGLKKVISILIGILLVSGGSIGIYKALAGNKDKGNAASSESVSVVAKDNEKSTSSTNSSAENTDSSDDAQKNSSADTGKVTNSDSITAYAGTSVNTGNVVNTVNRSGSTFNGSLVATVVSYEVSGKDVVVNVNVVNNYDKEVNLINSGIYMMNSNGKRFAMDVHKQQRNGGAYFPVVPGESKDFKFYLTDYVESDALTFKIDNIWCMGPESMNNKIAIQVK